MNLRNKINYTRANNEEGCALNYFTFKSDVNYTP